MSAFLGAGRPDGRGCWRASKEITFWPFWETRLTVRPAQNSNAHRRIERTQRLEQILSVRIARSVASDHTVRWNGHRWGVPRDQVCAGLRGARAEIERRLDGTHWLRFRGRYLPLRSCPDASRSASASGLRPPGLAERKPKTLIQTKTHYSPPPDHPWRKPWKRTFLNSQKPDILLCVDRSFPGLPALTQGTVESLLSRGPGGPITEAY
jgi:hypothetical protein